MKIIIADGKTVTISGTIVAEEKQYQKVLALSQAIILKEF